MWHFLLQLSNPKGPVVFRRLLFGLGDMLTLQLISWPKRRCSFFGHEFSRCLLMLLNLVCSMESIG